MATGINSFSNDVHLNPLYLKWAADHFRDEKASEGMSFFTAASSNLRSVENKVYEKLWELKGRPEGDPEYGRKSFHGLDGLSSSLLEKAQAIDGTLIGADRHELNMRENQVHKCLWAIHGRPNFDLEYGKHAFNHMYGRFASIQDKLSAACMYANNSRPFSWITSNEIVHLIKREDGELETLIVTPGFERSRTIPFDRRGHPMEETISLLKNCDVTVSGDFVIPSKLLIINNFDYRFRVNGCKEIRLLLKGNTLIWHEYDNIKKEATWINVSGDDAQTIFSLNRLSNGDRESALKDFTINISTDPSSGRLISINLAKVSFSSKMDPSKTIDRDNWAVTLISQGVSLTYKKWSLDPGFGHAKIIYEGVEKGDHFVKYYHLTDAEDKDGNIQIPEGHARVSTGNYVIEPNTINAKTPTWVRPRALVQQIEAENKKFYRFNQTGNPLLSPQLLKNCEREITHVIGDALVNTIQEALSPPYSRQPENRLISALMPNNASPFTKRIGNVFLSSLANNGWNELKESRYWVYDYNCLTLVIRKFQGFGIGLSTPSTLLACPTDYIRSVASNPSSVRINNT